MNDVVTTSSRNAAVERDEGPAVTTGQPEQVAVGDLLAGLRGSDFCHDRRRPWVGPELVRASVGSQEQQLIGCSLRQPGTAGQLGADANDAELCNRAGRPTVIGCGGVPRQRGVVVLVFRHDEGDQDVDVEQSADACRY